MKVKKRFIHILLVELIGIITFLSIALVIIIYLFTGVYKLTNETQELAVSSRVIQNVAEYCKGTSSKQECESILDRLGTRVTASKGIEWKIGYNQRGEMTEIDHAPYLVSAVMESEALLDGEWITVTLIAQRKSYIQIYNKTIQELNINKYYVKRG